MAEIHCVLWSLSSPVTDYKPPILTGSFLTIVPQPLMMIEKHTVTVDRCVLPLNICAVLTLVSLKDQVLMASETLGDGATPHVCGKSNPIIQMVTCSPCVTWPQGSSLPKTMLTLPCFRAGSGGKTASPVSWIYTIIYKTINIAQSLT